MEKTINVAKNNNFTGLCFVNLVDFDMEYGHRRDAVGYAKCIEDFDVKLGELITNLKEDDLLIITNKGVMIRVPLEQVKIASRNTQGVRVIRLDGDSEVSSLEVTAKEEVEEEITETTETVVSE